MSIGSLPARIVFMGTPEFAVASLDALLAASVVPVAVYTQCDKPAGRGRALTMPAVKAKALERALPVFQPKTLKSPAVVEELRALAPDVIAVAAYGQILPREILDIPPLGCVNVHASLLPRHRGASPIAHAIWAGDEEVGVSIMRMETGLDTGPVYVMKAMPVPTGITTGGLTPLLATMGGELLVETLRGLNAGGLKAAPQDDGLATLAPRIKPDWGRLDFTLQAQALERQVRAFDPWPGTFFEFAGEHIKVLSAAVGPAVFPHISPGQVLDGQGLAVACGNGTSLLLSTIQRAGKRPLPSSEVLRGFKIPAGTRL